MNLVSVGDRIKSGFYKLHSKFNRAVNFISSCDMVFIVTEEIGSGPLNIVVQDIDLKKINTLEIREDSLILNNFLFKFNNGLIYDSSLVHTSLSPGLTGGSKNIVLCKDLLLRYSHPKGLAFLFDAKRQNNFSTDFERAFVSQMLAGADYIKDGAIIAGVKKLKGCGLGLTPSGDDFIAGLLIALNFLGQEQLKNDVYNAALGANIFCNTFLKLARDGYLLQKVKVFLLALTSGTKETMLAALQQLFTIGATSGSDLATGILFGLQL